MGKIIHGMWKTKVHRCWSEIRQRCKNKNYPRYQDYGGRGIKVCERWNSFINFYHDMGDPPTPRHSIDRIDNNKNYEPGNCKWSNPKEQQNHTRSNRIIEFNGRKLNIQQWSEIVNINHSTIRKRIDRSHWSIERALTEIPSR